LCAEKNGEFIEAGFLTRRVETKHGNWTITLEIYSVGGRGQPLTRLRAPYVNLDKFRFNLSRASIFTKLGAKLGMRDVIIGDSQFDDAFVTKGNDENRLRELFSNEKLRTLISVYPNITLAVRDAELRSDRQFPEGVDELFLTAAGVISDLNRLRIFFYIVEDTLDQLCRIGSADESTNCLADKSDS